MTGLPMGGAGGGDRGRRSRASFESLFDGLGAPRPLPPRLRGELEALLAPDAPEALLGRGREVPQRLSADLRARLVATLAPPSGLLPGALRRRILRANLGDGFGANSLVVRAAAIAAAVLLVSGLSVAARSAGPRGERPLPGEVAGPPPVAETSPPETTVAPQLPTTTAGPRPKRPPRPKELVAYRSCEEMLDHTKQQVLAAVGPYGLGREPAQSDGGTASSGGQSAAYSLAEPPAPDLFSSTNVQEAGVDEADRAKTDGRRIVTVMGKTLRITVRDPASGALSVAGTIDLPDRSYASQLVLAGNRVVVFGSEDYRDVPAVAGEPARFNTPEADTAGSPARPTSSWRPAQWSSIRVIDVTDPAAMRVVSTLYLEGTYRAARLAKGRVRVVVTTSRLGPVFESPTDGSEEAKAAALARNREIVAASTIDDWTPRYVLVSDTDPVIARAGRLCACDDVLRPKEFGGITTTSIVTIDPANPLPRKGDHPSASVQGSAEIVYASPSNLYVTSTRYTPPPPADRAPVSLGETAVHRFDIRGTAPARYVGSGKVRGSLLSQWAISERDGYLRVASTETRPAAPPDLPQAQTESFVTTLAIKDASLDQIGQVGGLGHDGERIRGVRFIDDLGYVVTFRQTDPLYVIDLGDPTRPRVRGELAGTGYSAYLHPLEPGYLLGVGQEATEKGNRTGAQVSSLDVRNPEQPTQVDRLGLEAGTSSPVEGNHLAFLYWPATRTAVVPISASMYDEQGAFHYETGAVIVNVSGDHKLSEIGRVTHDGRRPDLQARNSSTILRSFVIGDTLFTLSYAGLLASDLRTLAEQQWLPT